MYGKQERFTARDAEVGVSEIGGLPGDDRGSCSGGRAIFGSLR